MVSRLQIGRTLQCLGGLGLICSLIACEAESKKVTRQPKDQSNPLKSLSSPTPLPTPKLTKMQVTVDVISDLKVKEGTPIVKGQIIAEPVAARQRLSQRRQAIQQQLVQLNNLALQQPSLSRSRNDGEGVRQAQARLSAADAAIANYRQNSPFTEYALKNLPLPEEQLRLERLQAERQAAQAALKQAKDLARAQAAPSSPQNQSRNNLKVAQSNLQQELQQLDVKAKKLKVLYSPHTGFIRQIKPLSTKGALQFELTIAAQPLPPTSPTLPSTSRLPGSATPTLPSLPNPALSPQDTRLFPPSLPRSNPTAPPTTLPN